MGVRSVGVRTLGQRAREEAQVPNILRASVGSDADR
jgi:hypothetical protein